MSKKKYYGHPDFYKIIDELKELHSRKNKTYAMQSEPLANFRRNGNLIKKILNPKVRNKALAYALILMAKQIDAVYDIVGEGKEDIIETLEDKLKDIAIYSVISIILNREGEKE